MSQPSHRVRVAGSKCKTAGNFDFAPATNCAGSFQEAHHVSKAEVKVLETLLVLA